MAGNPHMEGGGGFTCRECGLPWPCPPSPLALSRASNRAQRIEHREQVRAALRPSLADEVDPGEVVVRVADLITLFEERRGEHQGGAGMSLHESIQGEGTYATLVWEMQSLISEGGS